MTVYVKMEDTFFSGWGRSEGKTNLFVVECDTQEQADQICKAAAGRSEMGTTRQLEHCPKDSHQVLVSLEHFNNLGPIWTGK